MMASGREGEPDLRQRLYDLTRLVSDCIWEIDPEGRFSYVSGRVMDVLGRLPEEVLGRPFSLLCDDPALISLLAERNPFRDQAAVFHARDGKPCHMLVSALPFYDMGSGAFLGLRGSCRDVTEQVLAEAALKAQLDFQQTLLDTIPAPVFHRRSDGRYGLVNTAFATLVRRPPEAIVGRTLLDLFPPETADRLAQAEQDARTSAAGTHSVVDRLPWPDGESRDVILTLAVTGEDVAEGCGVIGVITDITDRMRTERDLHCSVRALERSNRELELFLHIASHDLQEPTRSVVSFCQLLAKSLEGTATPEQGDYIAHAVAGAKRMRLIVQDLGTYARTGSRTATPTRVEAAQVAAEALKALDAQVAEAGAHVSLGPLPPITADRAQVLEVFVNLLDNALKFTIEGRSPEIRIDAWRAAPEEGFWTFRISDNGIGIEPRHHERVFGLFQRVHSRDRYDGTGIGLAICRKIVERHGGRIWIDSTPGRGTQVLFTLPVAQTVSTPAVQAAPV